MFKKDYTIRIFSEAAQEMYFSCDFCKFNSWKKCWGIHCKIIKELKQLGFRPKILAIMIMYVVFRIGQSLK